MIFIIKYLWKVSENEKGKGKREKTVYSLFKNRDLMWLR